MLSIFRSVLSSGGAGKNSQMTYRSPAVQTAYDAYLTSVLRSTAAFNDCPLCDNEHERIPIEEHDAVRVIQNDYPYEVFNGLTVAEHLLVISRRHVGYLGQLTEEESSAYWNMCRDYSDRGYTVVTQAIKGSARSIPDHIHSHLILCDAR